MFRVKSVALVLPLLLLVACKKTNTDSSTTVVQGKPGITPKDPNSIVLGATAGSGKGSNSGSNPANEPIREVTKKSVKKFENALDDYKNAKSSGKLNEKCQKIADDFEEAFKEDKDLLEGLFNKGAILLECGKTKEAEDAFNKVLAQNKDYARAITSIGYIRYQEKNYSAAMAKFKEATEANDADGRVEAYVNLAAMQLQEYFAKGDGALAQESQKNIRRALAFDSTSVQAYAAFAMLYYKLDKLKLADLVCRKALEDASKDYAPIYHILGLVSVKQKKVTSALKWFNDALAKDPNYVPALMNVGGLTIRFRDYKTAQEKFAKVVQLEPKNYDATVSLGVAHRGLQNYEEAEKYYKAAMDLDPKNPSAYFNLGNLFQDYAISKSGMTPVKKIETAIDYYNKFKERAGSSKEWDSYVKQADARLKQCNDLRTVLIKTAAAAGSGN